MVGQFRAALPYSELDTQKKSEIAENGTFFLLLFVRTELLYLLFVNALIRNERRENTG